MKTKAKTTTRTPAVLPSGCDALLSRHQLCAALSISIRTLSVMLSTGELPGPSTHIGRRPKWQMSRINEWIHERCDKEDSG